MLPSMKASLYPSRRWQKAAVIKPGISVSEMVRIPYQSQLSADSVFTFRLTTALALLGICLQCRKLMGTKTSTMTDEMTESRKIAHRAYLQQNSGLEDAER